MPFFTPPTRPDRPMAIPGGKAWKLFKFYPRHDAGMAVWKDQNDVWHQSMAPDHGDRYNTVIMDRDDSHNPSHITSGPTPGLGNAKVVYLGGHRHPITDDEALELIAAGYGAYIEDFSGLTDQYSGGTPAGFGLDIYSGGTPGDPGTDTYWGGTP